MITKEAAKEKALAFLQAHTIGALATVSGDEQPFVSPVYYVVQPDFTIHFSTSHHTQKFKNLILNKRAAFCVGMGPEYIVVNIHGMVEMADQKEREEGVARIHKAVGIPMEQWPISKVKSLETGGLAFFKLTPTRISYLDLTLKDELGGDEDADYLYEIYP